ncbi:uncharacterized protein LOC62_01G000785 [Vanrija pseudolonga]|uniref:Purtative membrane protein n=1 Tax=Vanrija pseudolonga TaxID=143232 RepID=A0AAF0Y5P2_9TREE|nr:purtative membrane protein [Vanrija pseudolonga]
MPPEPGAPQPIDMAASSSSSRARQARRDTSASRSRSGALSTSPPLSSHGSFDDRTPTASFSIASWAGGVGAGSSSRRPALGHRGSDASLPRGNSVAGSLPTSAFMGPRRQAQGPSVDPQNDYLANWETLNDLIVNPGDSEVSPSPVRGGKAWGDTPSQRSLRSMITPTRSAFGRPIPGVQEDDEAEERAESSFSAVLSTSPNPMGEEFPSFGVAGDLIGEDRVATPTPQRPTPTAAPPRTPPPPPPTTAPSPSVVKDAPPSKKQASPLWPPQPWVVAIFKCGLAYFLASLFTFVPQLSALLSMQSETDVHGRVRRVPAYSAHMVATIVVYFNPARTKGGMILSTRYCIILAGLAAIVSLISFGIIRLFDHWSPSNGTQWDWISEMGDWAVCILCIGGAMGGLAWAKVWVGNPAFNTGCSMAAVTLFTVIVKEGGMTKLEEVLFIVIIGATITNLVSFLVFPVSATSRLQNSISKSLKSFSTLLDLLTSCFLLEKTVLRENRMTLAEAVKSHGAAFKSLKADLSEAKHERIIDPRVRGRKLELYDAALGSMARLAQHLAGMRSSTRMQEALIRASLDGRIVLDQAEKDQSYMAPSVVDDVNDVQHDQFENPVEVKQSIALFLELQHITGDDMDNLVTRCDEALDAIEDVTYPEAQSTVDANLTEIRTSLATALQNFSRASSRAIKRVYAGPRRRRGILPGKNGESSSSSDEEGSGGDKAVDDHSTGPNEVIFLVYFFLFTLEEFARELLFLLDTVYEIVNEPQLTAIDQIRSILAPWQRPRRRSNYLYKQLQRVVPIDPSKLQPPLFPRTQRDKTGTLLTPGNEGLSRRAKISQWFWKLGSRIREPDLQYAIKTGVAGAMLAAPAYIERTRPIFLEYRGEWALIAFFATMSPTVGQTNFLSFFRIVGTLLGGAVAVLACTLFPEDPVSLPIFGYLFSLPCFYIITQMPDYAQAGRFILLTYNLTCLYAYNLRESTKDLSPLEIAVRRSTSVITGVIWAGIVSRYWWPYTARRELRMGLGDFCLDLSYLYSKLVTAYTRGVEHEVHVAPSASGETTPLLPIGVARHHLSPAVLQFMSMELHLQSQLATLRGLLSHAKNEPRIKGPFAFDFYQEVLLSCERMLDKLHSMRCVTTRHDWDNSIREAFVLPVNNLQREMAGNVILYFYTLSAGFRLRIPMPPYLPPAENARDRLVEAIRNLDEVKQRSVRGGGRHLLFFAYALAMQEVIAELDYLGGLLQDAFGVISQSTVRDFEELFVGGGGGQEEYGAMGTSQINIDV